MTASGRCVWCLYRSHYLVHLRLPEGRARVFVERALDFRDAGEKALAILGRRDIWMHNIMWIEGPSRTCGRPSDRPPL